MTKLLPTIILSMVPFFTYGHEISQMDDVTLCKESILLDSIGTSIINDRPCATFYIHAQKDMKSHLRFRLMGGQYEDSTYTTYPLLIDNEDTEDSVVANTANWHDAGTVSDSQYFFSAGNHEITLAGSYDNVPNVEGLMFPDIMLLPKTKGLDCSPDFSSVEEGTYANRDSRYIGYDTIPDSNSPSYHFEAELNKGVSYTFFRTEYFKNGQNIVIRTDTLGNTHHIVYLFYANNPGMFSLAASSETSSGGHAMLLATAPLRGLYYVMVRSNTEGSTGRCNISINNVTYSNVLISCSSLTVNHAESGCQYASFALNKTGNPIMWQISGGPNGHVKAWNDDYSYDSSTSDFNWGTSARIDGTITNGDRILVASKNSNVSIVTDIYAGCKNVKSYSLFCSDSNVKPADVLASGGNEGGYNCIAWSVGEWATWHSPGGLYIGYQTFDDFYAQYGLTRVGASEANSCVDLWGGTMADGSQFLLHASVKAKSNPYSTGYDWESKVSNDYRVFHPRYSMLATYGEVIFHLRKDPSFLAVYPSHYPIDFRVLATSHFTKNEQEQIQLSVDRIEKQTIKDFISDYEKCELAGRHLVNATIDNYDLVDSYQDIVSSCFENPQLLFVVFKRLGEGSILALKLLKDVFVPQNIDLAKKVLSQSDEHKYTDDGKIIIRPIVTDGMLFAKAVLAQLRGENERLCHDDLSFSDSPKFYFQLTDHRARINLSLSETSNVKVMVANLNGSEIRCVCPNKMFQPGNHAFEFGVTQRGYYVVSVIINGEIYEKKFHL